MHCPCVMSALSADCDLVEASPSHLAAELCAFDTVTSGRSDAAGVRTAGEAVAIAAIFAVSDLGAPHPSIHRCRSMASSNGSAPTILAAAGVARTRDTLVGGLLVLDAYAEPDIVERPFKAPFQSPAAPAQSPDSRH
jgi:hypothetical protein